MVLTCWAWWGSVGTSSYVTNLRWIVGCSNGGVAVEFRENRPPSQWESGYRNPRETAFTGDLLPLPRWQHGRGQRLEEGFVGQEYRDAVNTAQSRKQYTELRMKYDTPGSWHLFIPYWLLLLSGALLWAALLVWRRKRDGTLAGPAGRRVLRPAWLAWLLDRVSSRRHQARNPALYRSLSFWSGIVVIAFICWAWRDSRDHRTRVVFKGWGVEQYKSALEFWPASARPGTWERMPAASYLIEEDEDLPAPFFKRGGGRRDYRIHIALRKEQRTLREKTLGRMEYQKPTLWRLFIPHWLILSVVGSAWLGLLILRSRRVRTLPSPPPEAIAGAG